MMKWCLLAGSMGAGLSVVLGAFAAHGLKHKLSPEMLSVFQTGVQYQMYHSLALILLFILQRHLADPLITWAAGLMLIGMVFFSGSLYGLAMTQVKWFGPITPIGGMCFIMGWVLLVVSVIRHNGS